QSDAVAVFERSQIRKPNTIGESLERALGEFRCQSRLATAPDSGERQHPRVTQCLRALGQLALPSDEAGTLAREVVGNRLSCSTRLGTRRYGERGGGQRLGQSQLVQKGAPAWIGVQGTEAGTDRETAQSGIALLVGALEPGERVAHLSL